MRPAVHCPPHRTEAAAGPASAATTSSDAPVAAPATSRIIPAAAAIPHRTRATLVPSPPPLRVASVTAAHMSRPCTGGTPISSIIARKRRSAATRAGKLMPGTTSQSGTRAAGVWRPYRPTSHDMKRGIEAKSVLGRLARVTATGGLPSGGL